jgi:hypothetical protein
MMPQRFRDENHPETAGRNRKPNRPIERANPPICSNFASVYADAPPFAMQKVEGSSPFIRSSEKPCKSHGFFVSGVGFAPVSHSQRTRAADQSASATAARRPSRAALGLEDPDLDVGPDEVNVPAEFHLRTHAVPAHSRTGRHAHIEQLGPLSGGHELRAGQAARTVEVVKRELAAHGQRSRPRPTRSRASSRLSGMSSTRSSVRRGALGRARRRDAAEAGSAVPRW